MREKLGKYELIRRIGGGSYGLVYEAFDPHLKRPVAIKICTSRDDTARQRFYREAEIAGNLVHPNITTVHDFGFHGDVPFLVEEFLDGEDLDTRIRRGDALSLSQQLDYLVQAASGLGHAHQQGIVHRDVKPSNLRILADDSAKLLDFGTAKRAESESQLTQSGTTVGTAAYLSPEILRGHEASPRSDTFSFGVLAYELLSGGRPFPGRQIAEVLSQILHEEPAPLRSSWPDCPSDLEKIVTRCLTKEVEGRYANCAEVATELERCIVNHFGPSSPIQPVRATPRQPPELTPEGWLESLLERARDLARARELPRALAVLATTSQVAPNHPEVQRQLENVRQRLQRRSRTGVASDRYEARDAMDLDEAAVDKALAEMRAVLYIGNIEGVEEVLRRHRSELAGQASIARLRSEIAGRLAGIRAAIEVAAQSVVEDGLATAKQLLAEQRLRPAARLLRTVRPLATGDEVESTLHIVAATQRSTGPNNRQAEIIASIEGLLNQKKPVEAADALRFALRLYGKETQFGPLVDHLVEAFRDEARGIDLAAAQLAETTLGAIEARRGDLSADLQRRLLGLALTVRPHHSALGAELVHLNRQDGGQAMRDLMAAARTAATSADYGAALTALLEAHRLAPENPEILNLLQRAGSTLSGTRAPPNKV